MLYTRVRAHAPVLLWLLAGSVVCSGSHNFSRSLCVCLLVHQQPRLLREVKVRLMVVGLHERGGNCPAEVKKYKCIDRRSCADCLYLQRPFCTPTRSHRPLRETPPCSHPSHSPRRRHGHIYCSCQNNISPKYEVGACCLSLRTSQS